MKRTARAMWVGGLKDGKGSLWSESGVLASTPYAFASRFEGEKGTNPEELVAAALAGCFSMALSGELGKMGMTPQTIETRADLTFEKTDAGWTTTAIHLDVTARIPNANRGAFEKAAETAKKGCPISRLLNTTITMKAGLA